MAQPDLDTIKLAVEITKNGLSQSGAWINEPLKVAEFLEVISKKLWEIRTGQR
jgi:hypothetical protein